MQCVDALRSRFFANWMGCRLSAQLPGLSRRMPPRTIRQNPDLIRFNAGSVGVALLRFV
jgi:hypothetical protein